MNQPTCPTGHPVMTQEIAAAAAQRSRTRYEKPMQAYKCTHCGHWHVGAPSNGYRKKPMKFINRKH